MAIEGLAAAAVALAHDREPGAQQQERLIAEQGQMRDDLRVMMAILQRIDGTLAGLVNEIRAEHPRVDRLDRRLRALETPPE